MSNWKGKSEKQIAYYKSLKNKTGKLAPHYKKMENNLKKTISWTEEFNKEFDIYGGEYENMLSVPKEIIKTFIEQLRLSDRDELIKMLPEELDEDETNYDYNYHIAQGYNMCLEEIEQLIEDYYNK